MPPTVSIIYTTYRPGGIDLFVESLKKQTFTDYEVILADDYKQRNRSAVADYFRENRINLAWQGESKPKCYPQTQFNQINAMNTGVVHCTPGTKYIVAANDYIMLRPDCMKRWAQFANDGLHNRWAVSGIADIWRSPIWPKNPGSIKTFDEPFGVDMCTLFSSWIPTLFELFYFGMPTPLWIEMNGFDERTDEWREIPVMHFPDQCRLLGIKLQVDHKNIIDMLHHREWGGETWHINNFPQAHESFRPADRPKPYPRSPNCFSLADILTPK